MGAAARHAAGISDSLLRLSIGLEVEVDILGGLAMGLVAAGP